MKRTVITFIAFAAAYAAALAQNPCIHHLYTADPAPVVYEGNDSLYVYVDIDEGGSFYTMNEWRVYSTCDLVNWTDHGSALPLASFRWSEPNTAWASQCIRRGNYYYWYVCCSPKGDWRQGIALARSDKPSGPFKVLSTAQPMIFLGEGGDIDPTVFIDDDGQAYLYWGNNKVRYVKLNSTMMSYDRSIGKNGVVTVPLTKEAFGGVKVKDSQGNDVIDGADAYEEGPWLSKHDGKYYLSYAAGGVPEHLAYSMSDSPEGPWKYMGQVMRQQDTGSFTNHGGVIDYKGHSYLLYHTGWLPGGGGFTRSFAMEEFHYNADGTIPEIKATRKGVAPIATLDPYVRQQAETMNKGIGIKVTGNESAGVYVTGISSSDSIRLRNVDFGSNAPQSVNIRYSCTSAAGYMVIRLDKVSGRIIAKIKLEPTGGQWAELQTDLTGTVTGIHDFIFTFISTKDSNELKFDWWQFSQEAASIKAPASGTRTSGSLYNLHGQPVDTGYKGIVISQGRKILMK